MYILIWLEIIILMPLAFFINFLIELFSNLTVNANWYAEHRVHIWQASKARQINEDELRKLYEDNTKK